MKKILLAAFIILVLVQWFVPGKMIYDKSQLLVKGKAFKFETEPVDPVDPFRGRYIILNYKEDTFRMGQAHGIPYLGDVYVTFTENEKGFAKINSISIEPPVNERYYVKAKASSSTDDLWYITYPFEEFYMEESRAQAAEATFRRTESNEKTYALVRIMDGDAIIENVYLNGEPLVK
jgi:uncharacterized membrane-anchored protein